jgi:hypothetical protein
MKEVLVYNITPPQRDFLERISNFNGMLELQLRSSDVELINYILLYRFYTEPERIVLNKIRKNYITKYIK